MRNECVPQLNPEQRAVYDSVMAAIDRHAFFVDGLGGTGKTFLYICLLSTVCAQGQVDIAVASSGIVALLLDGGHTAHSPFKILVQGLNSTSTCYINRDSKLAALLQVAVFIVWDEAVMMHKHVFEAINRSLQEIMVVINPTFKFLPFGGLVVVFGGDFRQILPVVPRGTKGNVVAAALNHSNIWQHVRVFKLHTNMRVQRLLAQGGAHAQADATRQHAFADYLQRVGEGTECMYPSIGEDSILIPHDMCYNGLLWQI
jgi:ATP-dependent DNA helicase PIF1